MRQQEKLTGIITRSDWRSQTAETSAATWRAEYDYIL